MCVGRGRWRSGMLVWGLMWAGWCGLGGGACGFVGLCGWTGGAEDEYWGYVTVDQW